MNPLKQIMMQAVSGMSLEQQRVTVASENISNVDTPGYRRKLLLQEALPGTGADFAATKVMLDETPGQREYDPSNPMADDDGYVTMSNVSLITEMAEGRDRDSLCIQCNKCMATIYRGTHCVLEPAEA